MFLSSVGIVRGRQHDPRRAASVPRGSRGRRHRRGVLAMTPVELIRDLRAEYEARRQYDRAVERHGRGIRQ